MCENLFDELIKAAAELGVNVVDLVPYSYCYICGGEVWDARDNLCAKCRQEMDEAHENKCQYCDGTFDLCDFVPEANACHDCACIVPEAADAYFDALHKADYEGMVARSVKDIEYIDF
jgi:hypothetical protein